MAGQSERNGGRIVIHQAQRGARSSFLAFLRAAVNGRHLHLTSVTAGVAFDVNGDGVPDRAAWTLPGARVGFLVLDRNGNGVVDSLGELFGQAVSGSRRPDGPATSLADVALFDRPESGGNGDGVISAADAVFAGLRIWIDLNHDGVSQPGELLTLAQAGIVSIELTAQPTGRRDRFGNYFRARVVVHLTNGQETTAWDVFLAARLTSGGASAAWLAGPLAGGLAGLGAGLVALGLASLRRTNPRRRLVFAVRLPPSAAARASLTGLTALAVVLLGPAPSFGRQAHDWQVVEYYDTDAVGSVRVVTDAQGQVVARHDFLPFGEEPNPQHEPPDKRLYTGQERDFETGQDYFGYRQLRADLGRFLAPDPITLVPRVVGAQGVNSYAYVRNNPLRLIDPNGLDAIDLDDVEPLDLYASGDWGEDPGDTLATDGSLNDSTEFADGDPSANQVVTANASGNSTTITSATFNPKTGDASFAIETRTGEHPFRDNNPGDVAAGAFADRHGAVGTDGKIAIFATVTAGWKALNSLLTGPSYNKLTMDNAIKSWAPPKENDTAKYQAAVTRAVGVSGSTVVSTLSSKQLAAMEHSIAQQEGFYHSGTVSTMYLRIPRF